MHEGIASLTSSSSQGTFQKPSGRAKKETFIAHGRAALFELIKAPIDRVASTKNAHGRVVAMGPWQDQVSQKPSSLKFPFGSTHPTVVRTVLVDEDRRKLCNLVFSIPRHFKPGDHGEAICNVDTSYI